jgi:hypothetical protein
MLLLFSMWLSRHEIVTMTRVSNRDSVARNVRRKVTRSRDQFWRVEDFDGDAKAVDMALSRLVAQGEVDRVRRNIYWRGHKTRFGMTAAPSITAVREVLGDQEAVGAAEWYATNLLGLSTQVTPTPVIAVSRRAPTGIPDIRFVNRSSRTARREARLNEIEVTVLEALEGWDRFVELDAQTATAKFLEALDRDDVRVARLVRAARTESPRVRERLRYLLERAGRDEDAERIPGARSPSAREQALSVVTA